MISFIALVVRLGVLFLMGRVVVVFSNAYRFSKILHDVIGTSGGHIETAEKSEAALVLLNFLLFYLTDC